MRASWMCMGLVIAMATAGGREAAQAPAAFACGEKLQPYVQTSLFLDRMIMRSTGPQRITDKRWRQFTQEVLMREFPAGGSVFENTGWWKSPSGRMDSSTGFTVVLTAPVAAAAEHRAAAERVVAEVKRQFGHESVLREEEVVCAAF